MTSEHLTNFGVIELRRYVVKEGQRSNFAARFEAYFPEAYEQVGGIFFGHFFDRGDSTTFTWIRGYHTNPDRGIADAAFYYGPVWREHRETMINMLANSDNVLQLTPASPERTIPVLPAVDPVLEPGGARGVVVAQIFPVKAGSVETFLSESRTYFRAYQSEGMREAGVLVTLDAPNTFPSHSIRTDGPFVVWLGITRDSGTFESWHHRTVERASRLLSDTALLREKGEVLVLEPCRRSRLRWLPGWHGPESETAAIAH
jgi:hypothetical protein